MTFCENSEVFPLGSVAVMEIGGWPAAFASLSRMSNGASPAPSVVTCWVPRKYALCRRSLGLGEQEGLS